MLSPGTPGASCQDGLSVTGHGDKTRIRATTALPTINIHSFPGPQQPRPGSSTCASSCSQGQLRTQGPSFVPQRIHGWLCSWGTAGEGDRLGSGVTVSALSSLPWGQEGTALCDTQQLPGSLEGKAGKNQIRIINRTCTGGIKHT